MSGGPRIGRRPIGGWAAWIGLLLPMAALSHGAIHERLATLDRQIERTPRAASLYVQRGRVYRDAEHWEDALNDYTRARELNPRLDEALYWQGEAWLRVGELERARDVLQQYLERVPASPAGHRALAQVLVEQGEWAEAARHFDRSIASDGKPPAQTYLERARALAQIRPVPLEEIRRGLEQGLAVHPYHVAIVSELIDVDRNALDFGSALQRFEQLPPMLQNLPEWLNHRAELEAERGDREAAAGYYRAALSRIAELPPTRQQLPAIASAQREAETGLEALQP